MDEELEGFIEGGRAEFGEVSGFWVVDAEEAIAAVKRVIEIYNTRRLHEKLGYKTPAAYREEMAKAA